jgi:uncharacterized protein involved in exopolysaccharide biosynthesis
MGMLHSNVTVTSEARSYLISISFTAPSADEAARIANAFAFEYLREKTTQGRKDLLASAEAELMRQLATNGERHPKVLLAAGELSAARTAVAAATNAQTDIATDESVTLAMPNHTPTSPKGSAILVLALVVGLMAGLALAIRRDRLGIEPHRHLHDLLLAGRRLPSAFARGLLVRLAPSRGHMGSGPGCSERSK